MNIVEKLTEEQKERLGNLLENVNAIFAEEDNGYTEDNIDIWYNSKLCNGIADVMYQLERWC